MSVDSFAKIDMSLDEIIQLQRKEKKKAAVAAKRTGNSGNKLTVAQRKRAEVLKLNARNLKRNKMKNQQQGQPQRPGKKGGAGRGQALPRLRMDAVKKRANILKRNRTPMTRGGRIPAARSRQLDATSASPIRQKNKRPRLSRNTQFRQNSGNQRTSPRNAAGAPTVKDRLGVRIEARQTNQRGKRQQVLITNRRGRGARQASRGRGRDVPGTLRVNVGNKNFERNVSQNRNRQYNQQPRRGARRQQSGGQAGNYRGQQRSRRGGGSRRFATNVLSQALNKPRGQKRAGRGADRGFGSKERSVTLY